MVELQLPQVVEAEWLQDVDDEAEVGQPLLVVVLLLHVIDGEVVELLLDRKSTRLNSSHTVISYAVFCLKKKN